jgi:beta-glucanase (GH16 family)
LYTADNVATAVVDGRSALVLTTRLQHVEWDGILFNVTSGRVDTQNKVNVSFGRVEVCARLQNDAVSGLHTAHWMVGYDCWPVGAEIDIMECQSPRNIYEDAGFDWQVATSNYHFGPACSKDTPHSTGTSAFPRSTPSFNFTTDWTVFAVEWNKVRHNCCRQNGLIVPTRRSARNAVFRLTWSTT